jgi:hypothetical protein
MTSTRSDRSSRTVLLAAAFVVTLMLFQTTLFAGTCATAVVDEAFVLPDGSERAAGRLSLCVEKQFSPVQTLHEVMIDGMPIGMTLSRHENSGVTDSTQAAMIFTRGVDGRLYLRGYTTPARENMDVFTLQRPRGRLGATTARATAVPGEVPVVLIAALTN